MSKIKGSIQAHTNLINQILKEIPKHHPELVALKFDAGTARALHNPDIIFNYGNKGFPDILILCWNSHFIVCDAKTGNAKLNKAQQNFDNRLGDIQSQIHTVHSVNEVLKLIKQAKKWWNK